MKYLSYIGAFSLSLVFSTLWAATPAEQATAILQSSSDTQVEELVDVGKASTDASGQVMVVVVRNSPDVLEETLLGLSQNITAKEFFEAVSQAYDALGGSPELQRILLEASEKVFRASYSECTNQIDGAVGSDFFNPPLSSERVFGGAEDLNSTDDVFQDDISGLKSCGERGSADRIGEDPLASPS